MRKGSCSSFRWIFIGGPAIGFRLSLSSKTSSYSVNSCCFMSSIILVWTFETVIGVGKFSGMMLRFLQHFQERRTSSLVLSHIRISSFDFYPAYSMSTVIVPITLISVSFAAYSFFSCGSRISCRVSPSLSNIFFPATDISAPVSGIATILLDCFTPFF